jgi:hypothetical protein
MGIIERMGRTYTFSRTGAGAYVDGNWVAGAGSGTFDMAASIQRLTPQETAALPEGQRTSEWIRIYTPTQLQRTNESLKLKGDLVNYNGRQYEVMKIENWTETRIQHYKALAVLLEQS